MRVGIDAHTLGTGAGGNETYVRELIYSLRDHAPEVEPIAYIADARAQTSVRQMHRLLFRSSWLRVPVAIPWAALRTRPGLLHLQYIAPPWCPVPYVVSVHDIVWLRHPDLLGPVMRRRLEWLMPGTLRRARRVFTLTEAVRRDLAAAYGMDEARVDVVPPALDPVFRPVSEPEKVEAVRREHELPERFVLYAGALQPRKNLVRLARAVASLRKEGVVDRLVVAGPRIWLVDRVMKELEDEGLLDGIQFLPYVPREQLPALMAAASVFAYVSLYEGFGLPVAEAMACGAPVVGSTDPAIREVAGEAAFLCDPLDDESVREGLRTVLEDAALRARLRAQGLARAAVYSREAMAQAAVRGYKAALGSV